MGKIDLDIDAEEFLVKAKEVEKTVEKLKKLIKELNELSIDIKIN